MLSRLQPPQPDSRRSWPKASAPLAALGFGLRPPLATGGTWVQRAGVIQGAPVRVQLWSDHGRRGELAVSAVIDELYRIDRVFSPLHAHSEISRINREAARRPVALSSELTQLLAKARAWATSTAGDFSLLSQAVSMTPADRASGDLELDEAAGTLRLPHEDVVLDLRGCIRGHAVDACVARLQRHGIGHARVGVGASWRTLGWRRSPQPAPATELQPPDRAVLSLLCTQDGAATAAARSCELTGPWQLVWAPDAFTSQIGASILDRRGDTAASTPAQHRAGLVTWVMDAQGLRAL